jgi:hypothetical protein
VRLHGTRIALETLVDAFGEGATAEEIAQQYPSASLADVYQAIGYYLRHATEFESYLTSRREAIAKARQGQRDALAAGRYSGSPPCSPFEVELRWLADENFNNDIVRALWRRDSHIDIVRAQDAGLTGLDDEALLAWAAEGARVLLTHDVSTMTAYAWRRVINGERMRESSKFLDLFRFARMSRILFF